MCCIISILLHLHLLSPFLTATLLPLLLHMRILLLSNFTSCPPHSNIYSHNPAAYEVPKDNTIANLAAGYEFAADDAACDEAEDKFYECLDNLPENEALYEAVVKAFEGACKADSDASEKACRPEDETSFDEAACKAASDKLNTCLSNQGVGEKQEAADKAEEEAVTGACMTEFDAAVNACPDDDQGENDQGDSPQM